MPDVFGQNDAAVDVPAVQQAVDAGGLVVLHGTFSFAGVALPAPGTPGMRVILVSGSVEIRGDDATILGAGSASVGGFQAAFLIASPEADVTIHGVRLEDPHNAAIRAIASRTMRIESCQIDGVIPTAFPAVRGALGVDLRGGPFGTVTLKDNRLRIGASSDDSTGGIAIIGPATRVEISGNRVRQTTAHGMNLQDVAGPAVIDRNDVETGPVGRDGAPGTFVNALRVLGSGSYRLTRNQLDCGFRNAAVLRIAATRGADVRQNEIVASVAAGETPGVESAGIQVRGTAIDNRIGQNRIRGRGRAAIAVVHSDFPPDRPDGSDGDPRDTTFTGNNVQQFDATLATVDVGEGAVNTTVSGGSGTILDNGTGTVVQGNFQPAAVPASGDA